MAGIGFELKKLFGDDVFTKRIRAYAYSTLVSVGPWIATVIVLNVFTLLSAAILKDITQKDLFMGTVVYSFVFSQIITAPIQMLIVRFLSDKLYGEMYDAIKPSFIGLNKILVALTGAISVGYYMHTKLPIYYIVFASALFILVSMTWIIMVYLSAIKNYAVIAKAFIYGSVLAILAVIITLNFPIRFPLFQEATNLLCAYTAGMALTYIILLVAFLRTFIYSNRKEFEFLTYFKKVPSLFFIGLFYTVGLWADDILMWFSVLGVEVFETYRFAPIYDNAVFFAFLTIIPTMTLFMVSIETEFYDSYRNYFGLISSNGPLDHIEAAKKNMITTVFRQIIYVMEIQIIITAISIIVAREVFTVLQMPLLFTEIFKITAAAALCNAFALIIMLVLLYFEARMHALIIAFVLFSGNIVWTLVFIPKGIDYYGFGYFIGSFSALLCAVLLLVYFLKDITYFTFFRQPMFVVRKKSYIRRVSIIVLRMMDRMVLKMRVVPVYILLRVAAILCFIGFLYGVTQWTNEQYSHTQHSNLYEQARRHDISRKDKSIRGRESKNWSQSVRKEKEELPAQKDKKNGTDK